MEDDRLLWLIGVGFAGLLYLVIDATCLCRKYRRKLEACERARDMRRHVHERLY